MTDPDCPVVVHVTTTPVSLGFLAGHVAYQRQMGFDVHVVSSAGTALDAFASVSGAKAHRVEMRRAISPVSDLAAGLRLTRVFRDAHATIVDGHTPKGGFLSMLSARLAGAPIRVYHVHGLRYETATGFSRVLMMGSEFLSCLMSSEVLCVSPSVRTELVRRRLCNPRKAKVLLRGSISGVDSIARFNPATLPVDSGVSFRNEHHIPSDALVIGFVGRIARDKGISDVLAAWRQLVTSFPNAHLLIVGRPEPADPVPVEDVAALEKDERVHLTGQVGDMPRVYSAMDVLAVPTRREGFPTVVLEAAAMHVPVVASRVTGCVDAVEDGITGTLVPPRDPSALASALGAYLRDPALRVKHGEAGRDRAVRDFRPEALSRALYLEYVGLMRAEGLPVPPRSEAGL